MVDDLLEPRLKDELMDRIALNESDTCEDFIDWICDDDPRQFLRELLAARTSIDPRAELPTQQEVIDKYAQRYVEEMIKECGIPTLARWHRISE